MWNEPETDPAVQVRTQLEHSIQISNAWPPWSWAPHRVKAVRVCCLHHARSPTTGCMSAQVSTIVGAISALRGKVGGGKDQGVLRNGQPNITPTNGVLPGGIPK